MPVELFQKIELPTVTYEQPLGLFINNEFVKGAEGKTFDVINPSNEEVVTSVHEATGADVDRAVKVAREAFDGVWSKTNANQRSRLLLKLADLMERDLLILASIEALDNGKSISMAKGDVQAAAGCIRYYGGWADKIHGKVIETDTHKFNYTKVEPIGVVGQIIPWNFPILMFAWKIGPALATGNTAVLKSAEQTPLSALYAAKLVKEAGFPPGVLNVLSGLGPIAGQAIAEHMDIDKVAFTGSTAVGRKIMRAAADSNLKKVTLELGGKSPNVVFEDADIDAAIDWANYGVFYNHGQTCCAGTRIFVQETIYDKFLSAFKTKTEKNAVGDPFHEKTFQGPQVSQLQFDRIMSYIDIGKKDGATLECGGGRHGEKGYFIQPTIFSNCTGDMKIMKEEIFGPVAAIAKFKDIDDLVHMANDTTYGLAAGVHTKDLSTAITVADKLKAGTVWINQYNTLHYALPFGGYKESGIGRELGKAALANYTQVKTVSINLEGRASGW